MTGGQIGRDRSFFWVDSEGRREAWPAGSGSYIGNLDVARDASVVALTKLGGKKWPTGPAKPPHPQQTP